MFDVGWSEIVVVGVVALLVVGPKELPALLRTVGKYIGMVKRQAGEFRAQFDEAMRETEIEQLKKDVENVKSEFETSMRDAERSVETEISDAKRELDQAADSVKANPVPSDPLAHDADGLPRLTEPQAPESKPPEAKPPESTPPEIRSALNGSSDHGLNGAATGAPKIESDPPSKAGS